MSTTTVTHTVEQQQQQQDVELQQVSLRRGHSTSYVEHNGQLLQHRHPLHHPTRSEEELTGGSGVQAAPHQDPLFLGTSKKTEDDLKNLKKQGSSKKVRQFYREQNNLIDDMLGPLNPLNEEEQEKQLLKLKIAVYGSVVANIILFALQLVAAITSGSLSIFATMADAFMDLLSSVVLMWASRQAARPNLNKYPAGKARMETAGIIVFSCLMGCVALFLIIESGQKLASNDAEPDLSPVAIAMVATALAVKLLLYIYCVSLSHHSSAKVLAQDHRNDLLVNALGLLTGIIGTRLASWVDPAGCILIALIILISWINTLIENIQLIVGKSADVGFLQRMTYIALTHPGVRQVDTCRAYFAGNNLFVEVDIVLPPDMPLSESHDIGEALQIKLESLPNVERAFVHADYETSHKPEHQKSK
ncbi:cation efflux family-domain-containing protein [Absidia repens]|uniref:Cation efflux family-domain-containing protein n=1 Tax=Absidia repens TaxID=90262 RepID=A0A1X2IEA8_9FUNG|nr:cation efflux family-domain-containing protein [Absidia repens]